jgi:uncharacterized protein (TIGR03437 family)
VTVGTSSTTATFTATAGTIASTQTGTITATLNESTQTATISLVTAVLLSGVKCSPASLGSGGSATCTATVTQTGGATVTLSSNVAALTVPASVVVGSGSTSATFTAAAGTITGNQTATITATLNGSTQTATISLVAPVLLSGVTCNPASLGSGGSATCTATVTQTGGATVALSSTAAALTVPASVTVGSSGTTATFTATAGTIASNQTASITATLNGSTQTATISLVAPALLSGVICSPASLGSGGSSTCAATVTQTGGATVTLSSNAAALTVPASVTIASGSTTATFTATAGTIASNQTATITATVNGSTQTATISLTIGAVQVASLSCSPDSSSAGTLLCAVQLSQAAPPNGAVVALQSNSSRVQVPSQLVIPSGSQSATFTAQVSASDQDEQPQISVSIQGSALTTSPMIIGIRPTALTCPTGTIQAGRWLDCEVQLNSPNIPEVARLVVSSTNPDLKVPAGITTRPGQTRLRFQVYADTLATQGSSNMTVQFGGTAVSAAVPVTPAGGPVLNIPGEMDAVFGKQVSFTVTAVDPAGLTVVLSVSGLPDGATFDPGTGRFSWTPTQSQQGAYHITLTGTNSVNASSTGSVAIVVDSGKPVITGVQNAASMAQPACSPASVASLTGRWLASNAGPVSDPSGTVTELGGTRVKVNGEYVSVVYASATRVDFACPGTDPRTPLTVYVENEAGIADPVSTIMYQTAPGIYSVDGSGTGQGLITLAGTSLVATSRSYLALGQPAEPGDSITIRATGIAALNGALPRLRIGGAFAQVQSVQAVSGVAGVYEITAEVPLGIPEGDAVPVVVVLPPGSWPSRRGPQEVRGTRGAQIESNQTTIAVEWPQG